MLQSIIAYTMTLITGVISLGCWFSMFYKLFVTDNVVSLGNLMLTAVIFGAFAFLFAYVAGI